MPPNQNLTSSSGTPFGIAIDHVLQAFARHVLHDDPAFAQLVVPDVVDGDQVRVLQIQALRDAADLDVQVPLDAFEGDFLAGVAGREIDFAKTTDPHTPLDRVSLQGTRT